MKINVIQKNLNYEKNNRNENNGIWKVEELSFRLVMQTLFHLFVRSKSLISQSSLIIFFKNIAQNSAPIKIFLRKKQY